MARGGQGDSVPKNLSFPPGFQKRLDELRKKRGAASDSELLRSAVNLLEAATDPNSEVVIRRKGGGKEKLIIVV